MKYADNEALCPNPYCNELAASLATIALGGELTADEQRRLLATLVNCAGCRRRLEGYAAVAETLPISLPEADPPADLRERIVAAARRSVPAQQTAPAPRRWPGLPPWAKSRPLLAFVLALVLVLSAGQQLQLMQQQEQIARQQAQLDQQQEQAARNATIVLAAFGNEDAQEGLLEPTGNAPAASGRFFISPGAPAIALYVKQLPLPPAGMEYQLWITSDDQTINGGAIKVNAEGRAWRLIQPLQPLNEIKRIFITLEPQGAGTRPTGPAYLTSRP